MQFQTMSFCYNVGEMLEKHNSCLYKLAYGKIHLLHTVLLNVSELTEDIKQKIIVYKT